MTLKEELRSISDPLSYLPHTYEEIRTILLEFARKFPRRNAYVITGVLKPEVIAELEKQEMFVSTERLLGYETEVVTRLYW